MSQTYFSLFDNGPFAGQIDLWAENGRYFQQIHAGMIGDLLTQIRRPLFDLGYYAGRETSLQILDYRQPDLYVQATQSRPAISSDWDYALAAAEILAEPGVRVDEVGNDFHAITIRETTSGQLVTIVEIISPRNKVVQQEIAEYQERREQQLKHQINVVEIDATRSVKRLLQDQLVHAYPYHIAVYLPGQLPRLIGIEFSEPLKRIALPLRGQVVPLELQAAYTEGYREALIPMHIMTETNYEADSLPFPALLTNEQHQTALAAVAHWQAELARLRET